MKRQQIAVLITCHNRREKTLSCLEALSNQKIDDTVEIQAYLVDAGSTDGTVKAVQQDFPSVNIIVRDDSLFWCGGMREAFKAAVMQDPDYYMWLNDDTLLNRNAVSIMLDAALDAKSKYSKDSIIVGSLRDPDTGKHTYGGVVRTNKRKPIYFEPVIPSGVPLQCDTMNGNCVMIPKSIALRLGNLSKEFTHRMGDTDYGLRAKAVGFSIWVTGRHIGTCKRNDLPSWLDSKTPLFTRLKIMRGPKGMPPREWKLFAKRHAGMRWPLHIISLFLRVLFPKVYARIEKQ